MLHLDIPELASAKRIKQPDGLMVYDLRSGTTLAVAPPPGFGTDAQPTQAQSEAANVTLNALKAMGRFDSGNRALAADKTLSDLGRAEKSERIRAQAYADVSEALSKAVAARDSVQASLDTALMPPQLAEGDAVGAILDREVRDMLRGASEKQLTETLSKLDERPRVLEAILRAPLGMGHITIHAEKVWSEWVEANRPQVAALRSALDAWEWAVRTISQVTKEVATPAFGQTVFA